MIETMDSFSERRKETRNRAMERYNELKDILRSWDIENPPPLGESSVEKSAFGGIVLLFESCKDIEGKRVTRKFVEDTFTTCGWAFDSQFATAVIVEMSRLNYFTP